VVFKLDILTVRDATEEEMVAGGKVEDGPDLPGGNRIPI
jgi:FKBP-type peptidyl-prolyl cis-trans isomerase SlyD